MYLRQVVYAGSNTQKSNHQTDIQEWSGHSAVYMKYSLHCLIYLQIMQDLQDATHAPRLNWVATWTKRPLRVGQLRDSAEVRVLCPGRRFNSFFAADNGPKFNLLLAYVLVAFQ